MRLCMRCLLLTAGLILIFWTTESAGQAQIKKTEPDPVQLGRGSGTITHSKANPRGHPANDPQFFGVTIDTTKYALGIIEINLKLGGGNCRAMLGAWKAPKTDGSEYRGPIAPGTSATIENLDMQPYKGKIFVSVRAHFLPIYDEDCSNTFEYTVYLKRYAAPATPYPGTLGSADYYDFRYKDFVARNPGWHPPDYYKDFGEKYFNKFMKETYPYLSLQGQKFLKTVGRALQQKIEDKLRKDPAEFARIERVESQLRDFTYGSHPEVYCDSGWGNLPEFDRSQIIKAIDWKDKYRPWMALWTSGKVAFKCGFITDIIP